MSKKYINLVITLFFFSDLLLFCENIDIGGSIPAISVPVISTLPFSNTLLTKLYVSSLFKFSSAIILSNSSGGDLN